MSGSSSQWLKGCGIGCGVVLFVTLLGIVGGSLFMMKPFREAVDTREVLDERFGKQTDYTPPADGAIPPERLEAFLSVRRKLMDMCPEFQATSGALLRMEGFDGVENPPKREILQAGWDVTKNVFKLGPLMGKFFQLRNEALLEMEMGRGEYTYIYVLAYSAHLSSTTTEGGVTINTIHVSPRVQKALASMLRLQLAVLETDSQAQPHEVNSLRAEIAALENDPHRWPWSDGLPRAIQASLAPYRNRLDEHFCAATLEFEFTRNRKFGIGIQGD